MTETMTKKNALLIIHINSFMCKRQDTHIRTFKSVFGSLKCSTIINIYANMKPSGFTTITVIIITKPWEH